MSDKPYILGIDEVGMGCLAGPVVSCGVLAPADWSLEGLRDSKKFTKLAEKTQRSILDKLNTAIDKKEIAFCLKERSNWRIDSVGIIPALKETYEEILENLYRSDCTIILDGLPKFDKVGGDGYDVRWIVKADSKFPTVMAASIIAKSYRDSWMKNMHDLHPDYNWKSNVGYGTPDHLEAIAKHGGSPLHRHSFAPLKDQKEDPRQLRLKGV